MRICVVNGSPKGAYSITLQTVLYMEKRFPDCTFSLLHAGQKIKALEKDFTPAAEALEHAELLLFAYPVYTFLAPSQLHRFIELVKASGVDLSGKLAAQITTSKHFYDVTAQGYLRLNCMDLGLGYTGGFSADMDDLLTEKGRREAESFFAMALYRAEHGCFVETPRPSPRWKPAPAVELPPSCPKKPGYPTVIITDCTAEDTALGRMIEGFQAVYPYETTVINLTEFPFLGGCLGCFRCAVTGKCVYTDGFDEFLRTRIQTASAMVYAFTIRDHCMGARFKMYDDRQFCNGHRTVTMGMPVAYLINGNLGEESNLRMVIEARADVGGNFLAGISTNEGDTVASIRGTAEMLAYALAHKVTQPQTFWGVGGMKIFRDLIYVMRGMMKADHRFYKAHGLYDFPQKKVGAILKMQLVGGLLTNPKILKKMGNRMNEGMLAPYRKALESGDKAPSAGRLPG